MSKQKFFKDCKNTKEKVNDYLVIAYCGKKPDAVVALAYEDELLNIMNKVQEKYCKDNIAIIDFTNIVYNLYFEEIQEKLNHETGITFDAGFYKIQAIPSHHDHYKMMKQNGLKHGEIVNAKIYYD